MARRFAVQDFYNRFPDDNACLDYIMKVRYGATLRCPKCGKESRFARIRKIPAYACPRCGYHIHPMQGTPFTRTHTPLQKWFYAIYLFTTSRKGVSAKEIQRQLGVSYPTAWRIGHIIRKYTGIVDGDDDQSGHRRGDKTYSGRFTVQGFFNRFPDDNTCLDRILTLRYGAKPECPKCGKESRFARVRGRPTYACPWCGYHLYPMHGTPFARTHTPLQAWFYAMYLFTMSRRGVSAEELQRQLGVSHPAARRIRHIIHQYMGVVAGDDDHSGHVDADET